ncbi:MAG: hypothetical protein ACKOFW_03885, partial [Planctomycetaceae bacterium]
MTAPLPRVLILGPDTAGASDAAQLLNPAFAPVVVHGTRAALQALEAGPSAGDWPGLWLQATSRQSLAAACLFPGAG